MNDHLFARIKPEPILGFIYRSKFSLYIYTSCKLMYGSIVVRKEIFEFLIWRECEEGCVFQMAVVSILSQAEFGRNDHQKDAPLSTLTSYWKFENFLPNTDRTIHKFARRVHSIVKKNAIKSYRVFKSNPKSMFRSSIVFDSWTKIFLEFNWNYSRVWADGNFKKLTLKTMFTLMTSKFI